MNRFCILLESLFTLYYTMQHRPDRAPSWAAAHVWLMSCLVLGHHCMALPQRSQPACGSPLQGQRGSDDLQSLSGDLQRSRPVCAPALQEQRGNDALQSLSDDLISQEKASLPDSGSPTKGVVHQAQEKTAGALDYMEKQSQPKAGDKVRTEVLLAQAASAEAPLTLSPCGFSTAALSR